MSDKIKILFQPSDLAGVGHFRSIWPAQEMQRNFKDSFDVKIDLNPNFNDLESLKKYDIIHFHRHFGPIERIDEIFDTLKSDLSFSSSIDLNSSTFLLKQFLYFFFS